MAKQIRVIVSLMENEILPVCDFGPFTPEEAAKFKNKYLKELRSGQSFVMTELVDPEDFFGECEDCSLYK